MEMMSGFVGIVILVEPAKPGEHYIIIIGKIVQEERDFFCLLDIANS